MHFYNKDATFAQIPIYLYGKLGYDLSVLKINVSSKEFKGLGLIHSQFWRQALKVWLDCNVNIPTDNVDYYDEVIWNNSKVKYRHNVLMWEHWIKNDIVYVGDLFLNDRFHSLEYVQTRLGNNANVYFQYYALYNVLPHEWRRPMTETWILPDPVFCGIQLNKLSPKIIRLKLLQKSSVMK